MCGEHWAGRKQGKGQSKHDKAVLHIGCFFFLGLEKIWLISLLTYTITRSLESQADRRALIAHCLTGSVPAMSIVQFQLSKKNTPSVL